MFVENIFLLIHFEDWDSLSFFFFLKIEFQFLRMVNFHEVVIYFPHCEFMSWLRNFWGILCGSNKDKMNLTKFKRLHFWCTIKFVTLREFYIAAIWWIFFMKNRSFYFKPPKIKKLKNIKTKSLGLGKMFVQINIDFSISNNSMQRYSDHCNFLRNISQNIPSPVYFSKFFLQKNKKMLFK